jgi:hypothetical protein
MTQKIIPITGPYKGVVSDLPTPGDLQAFDDVRNYLCRKGRIQTRPRWNDFSSSPDGNPVLKMITFRDQENSFHTLVLTSVNTYFLTAGPVYNLLTYPGGIPNLSGTGLPFSLASILNRVYFCNGSVPLLYADGSSAVQVAGNVPGSGFFLAENIQQLIMAPTVEPSPLIAGSILYPNRVRWSASGNPNEWDTGADFTAGFNDLVQVADIINGLATIGRNTYMYHPHGIIVMYPTSVGTSPFAFQDLSVSIDGLGLETADAYTLSQYGGTTVFRSLNDIYLFDGSGFTPIGLGNKRQIFSDLEQRTGTVQGRIVPNLGEGFDYLSYWLFIPGPNVTWVYSYDDRNWQRLTTSKGYLTCLDLVSVV